MKNSRKSKEGRQKPNKKRPLFKELKESGKYKVKVEKDKTKYNRKVVDYEVLDEDDGEYE